MGWQVAVPWLLSMPQQPLLPGVCRLALITQLFFALGIQSLPSPVLLCHPPVLFVKEPSLASATLRRMLTQAKRPSELAFVPSGPDLSV